MVIFEMFDLFRKNHESLPDPATWRCKHYHTGLEHPLCWQQFLETLDDWKIGYWDIEASNLAADFGWIISWAIKTRDKNEILGYVLQKEDYSREEADEIATLKLVEALSQYDQIITWYGAMFDRRFSFARVLINGHQWFPPKTIQHLDLYYQYRRNIKLSSLRLKSVGETLESRFGLTKKTAIDRKVWRTVSRMYDQRALAEVWDHNKRDVILLEEVHKILEPYINPQRRYL